MNNVVEKPAVNRKNISTISVSRLIVAVNAAKFYGAVGRLMTLQNIHYVNVLSNFKVKWDAYKYLRTQDDTKVQNVNDKE